MLQFIIRRLIQAVGVLIVVSIAAFLLVYLSGDPVATMIPLSASEADIQAIRVRLGLDQPIYVQYGLFVENALRGDLGESFLYRTSALKIVLQRLPATVILAGLSTLLAVIIGVPLAIASATRKGSRLDYVATFLSLLSISIPNFWLGILLILLFAQQLRWVPPSGKDELSSFILPTITLAAAQVGTITRLLRRDLLDVMNQDYINVARSKGLPERNIYFRHALKNALIPTVTVVGMNLGQLIGGSVIIESVFAWPGVGWLMNAAISARDLPLIRATVLIVAIFITGINLVVDLSYNYLDPRIRENVGGVS